MISIFAKPPYIIRHLQRVSSIIRGEQIAARLAEARLNPESDYENDVCIYVKPHVKPQEDFKFEGKAYLDIIDGFELVPLLNKHPEIPVIVISKIDETTMKRFVKNKVIFIPQHHLNFERERRIGKEIKSIGVVGSYGAFNWIPKEIKDQIAKRGLTLKEHSIFYPRNAVQRFYQSIDIQLIWRPYRKKLSNPLKIVNAASFGVPTIALDEPAFKEVEGCYLPVTSIDELVERLDGLIANYSLYEENCLRKAEEYHIDNICSLYRQL